jgi:hypothetical protein
MLARDMARNIAIAFSGLGFGRDSFEPSTAIAALGQVRGRHAGEIIGAVEGGDFGAAIFNARDDASAPAAGDELSVFAIHARGLGVCGQCVVPDAALAFGRQRLGGHAFKAAFGGRGNRLYRRGAGDHSGAVRQSQGGDGDASDKSEGERSSHIADMVTENAERQMSGGVKSTFTPI